MFGQFIIGPPGAGKTTYCHGMEQMLTALQRPHVIINLDPANDLLPYDCAIDVRDLVSTDEVMDEFQLGPNGALVYSMEYIQEHFSWLEDRIREIVKTSDRHYFIFDCPGQVELYAHHEVMNVITHRILKDLDIRLTCVHLIDSTLCTDGFRYLSAVLVSLTAMMHLEMPHVNVLSKMDILGEYARDLDFRLDFYVGVEDMSKLIQVLDDSDHPMARKFRKFTAELVDVIEDYNLVRFEPLDIQDKKCVLRVLAACDASNGRVFGAELLEGESITGVAMEDQQQTIRDYVEAFHEKYAFNLDDESVDSRN